MQPKHKAQRTVKIAWPCNAAALRRHWEQLYQCANQAIIHSMLLLSHPHMNHACGITHTPGGCSTLKHAPTHLPSPPSNCRLPADLGNCRHPPACRQTAACQRRQLSARPPPAAPLHLNCTRRTQSEARTLPASASPRSPDSPVLLAHVPARAGA